MRFGYRLVSPLEMSVKKHDPSVELWAIEVGDRRAQFTQH